ncbi:MAG: hypothetical protein IKC87_06440 [Clostridia bacterium]|nr:hypothetical protein [Clostridia bacterium]
MSRKEVVLGIDTSNYTTSVAIMSAEGELIANIKQLLEVGAGECGLRQSDALFLHTKNLPALMRQAEPYLNGCVVRAIGVSTRPRNVDGSYMPVFLSGVAVAESLSAALGAPIYRFSHQCGHIMAALYSSGRLDLLKRSFAAVHASGGTTEVLRVSGNGSGFDAELVGGTLDLNAGQVIDRVGVMLGMPFPSGAHLEKEALRYEGKIPKRKIAVNGMHFNLSGLENMARGMHKDGKDAAEIAAFTFDFIGRSIIAALKEYILAYGDTPVICAGGVMCNSIIKNMIKNELDAYFAEPSMSSDNAVGIAALALSSYKSNIEIQ